MCTLGAAAREGCGPRLKLRSGMEGKGEGGAALVREVKAGGEVCCWGAGALPWVVKVRMRKRKRRGRGGGGAPAWWR